MSSTASEIIVYGASGYTGKLIAESLGRRNIPFTAAGRNAERISKAMALASERLGRAIDHEVAEVPHDAASLTSLFNGARIVVNVTGPFARIGETVVKAALEANCNYLDTTGEQDFIFDMEKKYSDAFRARGLLQSQACAYMWTFGAMAAELALEHDDIDSIDLMYSSDRGVPSVASTRSFMRMLACPHYYLADNELVEWERAKLFDVNIPDSMTTFRASPWGGGAEPGWYLKDDRVRNCRVMIGAQNELMEQVRDGVRQIIDRSQDDPAARDTIAYAVADAITLEEPQKEDPRTHRCIISCHARGTTHAVTTKIILHSAYVATGELIAMGCADLLAGKSKAVGCSSAVRAFGHRRLLDEFRENGFLTYLAG
ncbi:MAG: saccharopine dehydrogenase [Alphaproteobacteria bacterium]|nr:saccharopine dehydrogenase [Alphaproteobacteria bacterium]